MVDYTKQKIIRLLEIDFIRFCIVGGTGFVINFSLLTLLHKYLGLYIFFAQLIGAEIALFSNFLLHHHWTYKRNKVNKTILSLVIQFHATSWAAVLGSALMVTFFVRVLSLTNLLALAVSSIIALFWNFFWSKFVVWKDVSKTDIDKIVG